jgi:hypothetical protein
LFIQLVMNGREEAPGLSCFLSAVSRRKAGFSRIVAIRGKTMGSGGVKQMRHGEWRYIELMFECDWVQDVPGGDSTHFGRSRGTLLCTSGSATKLPVSIAGFMIDRSCRYDSSENKKETSN